MSTDFERRKLHYFILNLKNFFNIYSSIQNSLNMSIGFETMEESCGMEIVLLYKKNLRCRKGLEISWTDLKNFSNKYCIQNLLNRVSIDFETIEEKSLKFSSTEYL